MKKKFGTVGMVVFLLLVGIASAAVLNKYGTIQGIADVEGPTFYAASDEKLLINEEPGDTTTRGATYKIEDHEIVFFQTVDFGSKDWYPIEARMSANTKLIDGSDPGTLELSFGYTDDIGDHTICLSEVTVDSSNYKMYNTSCSGSFSGPAKRFWYELTGSTDKTYRLKTWGKTKVKVTNQ